MIHGESGESFNVADYFIDRNIRQAGDIRLLYIQNTATIHTTISRIWLTRQPMH